MGGARWSRAGIAATLLGMRIVIAPDSFKESLPAQQVCEAIARGVRRVLPQAEVEVIAMADGGEGTVDALLAANGILWIA